MGHYTRFNFHATLTKDAPLELINKIVNEYWTPNVIESIHAVGDQGNLDIDHEFGQTRRWDMLFHGKNGEDKLITSFDTDKRKLIINSEFKNYDSEIDKFINWISPFIQGRKKKQFVGWYKGESQNEQINIYIER